jgi:DNA-binding MarR family transcriptional regulator
MFIYRWMEKKTATEIAKVLDMKRPNVSIEIGILYNSGLIEQVENKKSSPYRRRVCFELIGLSSAIQTHFAASKSPEA